MQLTREAVLLAGGKGMRLRSVTGDCPKALVEVCGRPFLFLLLELLEKQGIERVVLALGYAAQRILDALAGYGGNLEVRWCIEDSPLGTGGAMRLAAAQVVGDTFFGLNADSLVSLDLPGLEAALARSGIAAIQVVEVEDTARFGTVVFDERGAVTGYLEKTGWAEPGWISAGVYAFWKEPFLSATPSGPFSIEYDFFMTQPTCTVSVFPTEGDFVDIGTPESLARAGDVITRLLREPQGRPR